MPFANDMAMQAGPQRSSVETSGDPPRAADAFASAPGFRTSQHQIAFGPFLLSPSRRTLSRDGEQVALGGRSFDILCLLVERAGHVVSKDEIIDRVWPGIFTADGSLRVQISALRKSLRDGQEGHRYILSISNRGYSFIEPVRPLASELAQRQPSAVANQPSSNMPIIQDRIIGRDVDQSTLVAQIVKHRLVTLVGPGGVGKTTLAVSAVAHLLKRPEAISWHGVHFIDLAALSDARLISSTIAATLGVSSKVNSTLKCALSCLKDKELLLVIDNCEHLVEEVVRVTEAILGSVPKARVLATSREPLRIEGEQVQLLRPLAIPTTEGLSAEQAMTYAAIELFVERARARVATFTLRDEDVNAIVSVCRRLDGIPLAIEMAGGRMDCFGLRGLATALDSMFAVLTKGRRTALPRHQTLSATLDWSFNLLGARDQIVLQRLSAFSGAFTIEAAVAVASWGDLSAHDVVESLCDLVDRSLVTSDVSRNETFFRLLETTRAYARRRLAVQPEVAAVSRQHAEYCEIVLTEAEAALSGDNEIAWRDKLGWLIGDVRTALNWAFSSRGDSELGMSLTLAALPLWFEQSLIKECGEQIDRALSTSSSIDQRHDRTAVRLHTARACVLSATPGKSQEAKLAWTTAYQFAERLGDTDYLLRNLWGLWAAKMIEAEFPSALSLADRFRALAANSSDPCDVAVGHRLLAAPLHFLGDQEGALHHAERMISGYRAASRRAHIARYQFDQLVTASIAQSRALWVLGRCDQALRTLDASVDDAIATGHKLSLCNTLMQAACPIALLAGDLLRAERFTELLRKEAERGSLGVWHLFAGCFEGQILVKQGKASEGVALILAAIARQRSAGHHQYTASFNLAYAEALAAAGLMAEAKAALDATLAQTARNKEYWAKPELLRLKGELALCSPDAFSHEQAEELFSTSLELAIGQKALAWQIRSATSLARLRLAQGRQSEGRSLLLPTYNAFSEGHALPDLMAARSLLDRLG